MNSMRSADFASQLLTKSTLMMPYSLMASVVLLLAIKVHQHVHKGSPYNEDVKVRRDCVPEAIEALLLLIY